MALCLDYRNARIGITCRMDVYADRPRRVNAEKQPQQQCTISVGVLNTHRRPYAMVRCGFSIIVFSCVKLAYFLFANLSKNSALSPPKVVTPCSINCRYIIGANAYNPLDVVFISSGATLGFAHQSHCCTMVYSLNLCRTHLGVFIPLA